MRGLLRILVISGVIAGNLALSCNGPSAAPFTLTVAPNPISAPHGNDGQALVAVARGGFTEPVMLTVKTTPSSLSCSFARNSGLTVATDTVTIFCSSNTINTYDAAITGTDANNQVTKIHLTVNVT